MRKFGLIGKDIGYTASKNLFENNFSKEDYTYTVLEANSMNDIELILRSGEFKGLNVTKPYKKIILNHPLITSVSDAVSEIGATNCLVKKGKGYYAENTDVFGIEKSLILLKADSAKGALILGNGGAASACKFVCSKFGIPFVEVFRKSNFWLPQITQFHVETYPLIFQTTPVGTYPHVHDVLEFPFQFLSDKNWVFDLIYNPTETLFLKKSAENGAKTVNGELMLRKQAEKSWSLWNLC